jgi:hypothetical protein
MEGLKGVLAQYVDLESFEWSKTTVAVAIGTIVLGRVVWKEIQVCHPLSCITFLSHFGSSLGASTVMQTIDLPSTLLLYSACCSAWRWTFAGINGIIVRSTLLSTLFLSIPSDSC